MDDRTGDDARRSAEWEQMNQRLLAKRNEALARGMSDDNEIVAWVLAEIGDDLPLFLGRQLMLADDRRIRAELAKAIGLEG